MLKTKTFLCLIVAVTLSIPLAMVAYDVGAEEEKCEVCSQNEEGTDVECRAIKTNQEASEGMTDCDPDGKCFKFLGQQMCYRFCAGTPGSCINSIG